jgi:hypothetical protein
MNVKFYLDGTKEPKYILLEINRFNVKLSTKQKILSSKWDKGRQRGKGTYPLNQLLDKLEGLCIERIQKNMLSNVVTTKEHIIEEIAANTSLYKVPDSDNTFYRYAIRFAELHNWSKGFTNQYYAWLNGFNRVYPGITFEKMDYTFFKTYKKYGNDTFKKNTFAGHWGKFKRVLDDAFYSDIKIDKSYNKIKISREESFNIYLTKDDLTLWYKSLDQLPHGYLKNASALFLIGCHSGMRYGDFKNVKSNAFYKDDVLYYRVSTSKTSAMVTIPGDDILNHLLSMELKEISNQKMNDYIKEAALIIGLTDKIETNDGPVQKNELIKTHTARRTFATNAILEGIPMQFVMSITGHKTESEFRKYIKIDDIQNAVKFNEYKNIK